MTAQDKAKELVNSLYQPLGYLKCGVSSDQMWGYAKMAAINLIVRQILFLDELAKSIEGDNEFWFKIERNFLMKIENEISKL